MKIIGFNDIITNSSSEVFCIYDRESIRRIKELVNSLLPEGKTFDDIFNLEVLLSYNAPEGISAEEALKHDEVAEYPFYVEGFKISSKDPKYKQAAIKLTDIDIIFNHEIIEC